MAHLEIEEIVGVDCRVPRPMISTAKNTTASSRLAAGPANMISIFCHHFLA